MSGSVSSTADALADLLRTHAVALARMGQHPEAERCVSSLIRHRASPTLYSLLGKIQAQQGRWKDAEASLRLALDLDGRCEEASLALAAITTRRSRAPTRRAAMGAAALGGAIALTSGWVYLARPPDPAMRQAAPSEAVTAALRRSVAATPVIDLASIETIATLFLKFEPFKSQFGLNASAVQVGSQLAFSIRGVVPTKQVITDLRNAVAANGMTVQTTEIRIEPVYAVKPRETLHSIARSLYGDARGWSALWRANRLELSSPNLIRPGQILRIPAWQPALQTP